VMKRRDLLKAGLAAGGLTITGARGRARRRRTWGGPRRSAGGSRPGRGRNRPRPL
jgi:hypothetical protein